jgi:hypothetical protein
MSYSRLVPAFEDVDFVEQACGEELSSVGSGPDVGVVEPELVVSSEQGKPHLLSFTNLCHWYYDLLH